MLIEHLEQNLAKRDLDFEIRPGATPDDLTNVETRLNRTLPAQVRFFYESMNGLVVREPSLELFPVDDWRFHSENRLVFALVDGSQEIVFDTSSLNQADQWMILAADSDFEITFTMASFWGNKLFKWLDGRAPIWKPDHAA